MGEVKMIWIAAMAMLVARAAAGQGPARSMTITAISDEGSKKMITNP